MPRHGYRRPHISSAFIGVSSREKMPAALGKIPYICCQEIVNAGLWRELGESRFDNFSETEDTCNVVLYKNNTHVQLHSS